MEFRSGLNRKSSRKSSRGYTALIRVLAEAIAFRLVSDYSLQSARTITLVN